VEGRREVFAGNVVDVVVLHTADQQWLLILTSDTLEAFVCQQDGLQLLRVDSVAVEARRKPIGPSLVRETTEIFHSPD
jgi:hypothetical protein